MDDDLARIFGRGERMERRKWPVPAIESPQGQTGDSSDASGLSRPLQRGGRHFVSLFIIYMVFFGLIGALLSSRFPIGLGAFLFFTDDELIEWVLHRIGIRLVPDTLGPEFVKAFVFFVGLSVLLAYWKESAPGWLSPWAGASWSVIGATALACAALNTVSAAVVKKMLPRVGIEIAPNRQGWAIMGLVGLILGMLALFILVSDWLGGQ